MALYSGKTGYIKKGTTADGTLIGHMSSFSLELTTEINEVISYGETYKEKMPSIMDWTASADGSCDFETGKGQAELMEAYQDGELITIGLGLDEDTYFEGTCYIESLSIESSSDGVPTISISFAGSKAILFTSS